MLVGMPFTRENNGPKIFLRRLKKSWHSDSQIKTTHYLNPFTNINLYTGVARNYFRKRYVMRIDGVFMNTKDLNPAQIEVTGKMKASVDGASGIIFQSEFSKRAYTAYVGRQSPGSVVIGNGSAINTIRASYRDSLGFPKKTVILCSSHWRRHKRLSSIVRIVEIMNSRSQGRFHLVVLGSGADQYLPADKSWITWHGNIEPHLLYRYYKSADVYLHLAYIDNCPNTLVEAVANGLPVVTSNLGGAGELVSRANAGIVAACDKGITLGESVDIYNCPLPRYEPVIQALTEIVDNASHYKERIVYSAVDIKHVASLYKAYLTSCIGGESFEID